MLDNKENLKNEFFLSQYETIRPLGNHEPENTWLVSHISSGKLYVKKQIDKDGLILYQKRKDIINPHLVPIEYIYEGPSEFFVFEDYISGNTLEDILKKEGTLSEVIAINYILQLLDGLYAVHEKGIVHRDITPSNIIISTDNIVKIIDFGISRISDDSKPRDTRLLGTFGYASPEQFGFAQTDARSDIYSVGSLFYRMIYGVLPGDTGFVARNDSLGAVIQKAMRIDPDDRYKSANEMAKDLISIKKTYVDNNVPIKKSFFVPGFRTKKTWKMIIAILLYCCMTLLSLFYIIGSFKEKEMSNVRNILAITLVFWVAPLELADMFYWSKKAAIIGQLPAAVRFTIRLLVFLLILIIGIVIADVKPIPSSM